MTIFCACEHKNGSSTDKKVFRYNEAFGITSLDPAYANNQANIWACNHLYNGLIQLDDQLRPLPCIAKSWEILENGKLYVFHLQRGILFHPDTLLQKGRAVTANDFVFSFNRIANEASISPGSWIFNAVQRDNEGNVNGFEAIDDSTLKIHLAKTFPPFLGLLGSAYGAVVPHEVVEFYGKDFRKHPVGTGPFLFHQWIDRTALILHKNTVYFEKDEHGNKLPYLDAVVISFISDRQSAFLEFLKGKLDFIFGLDASFKDDLLTRSGSLRPKYQGKFILETAPYLNTEYLGIVMDSAAPVMRNNPLHNCKIRQAINYGFDRKRMITYLRNGMATPGTAGIVPLGIPGFDTLAVTGYDYNPAKAKQLLAEAGFPNGNGLPPIVMSTTNTYQDLCEFMQGQLAEIGIKIKLEVNQASQHRQMVAKQQLGFFRASWIADYADAENYLSLFYTQNNSPKGPNYTHFSSKEFDAMYDLAMQTPNDSIRHKLYIAMDQLMMEQSPVIILYYDKVLRLKQNNVEGLTINPLNLLNLKKVNIRQVVN
jgi:peptide/nickel transport system substrate-binding protein